MQVSKLHSVLAALGAPKTLDDWTKSVRMAGHLAKQMGKDCKSYGYLWMSRAYLIAEMRAGKIRGLAYNSKNNVADLENAFLDQCEWLQRFSDGKKQKVRSLLQALR